MYVITSKKNNIVLGYGKEMAIQENGYPLLIEEKQSFVDTMVDIHEVESIPTDIIDKSYTYTEEEGFVEVVLPKPSEPNNPYGLSNDLYNTVEQGVVDKIEKGVTA